MGAIMEHLARTPQVPRLIHQEACSGGERLGRLARGWIRPLIQQGMLELKRDTSSPWEESEFPLVISAWMNLVFGHFDSRSYLSMSLVPGREWALANGATVSLRAGLRADFSNRDEDALMPLFSLAFETPAGAGVNRISLEYSRSSQLPGYTALNSRPTGLFGGNPDLGHEYAGTVTLGFKHESARWHLRAALFQRRDEDLVDWTYLAGAPFVRQANAVDLDVTGFEAFAGWHTPELSLVGGFTWLDKDADYGNADVDASFYARNYARQRLTLALTYRLSGRIDRCNWKS